MSYDTFGASTPNGSTSQLETTDMRNERGGRLGGGTGGRQPIRVEEEAGKFSKFRRFYNRLGWQFQRGLPQFC